MHLRVKLFFLLFQFTILTGEMSAETSRSDCYQNITETTYKTVRKTRIKSVPSKNFFKKIVSKKNTQIEVYEEQEPVYKNKVERICCEGYKMAEYDLCEPQCNENGCPAHSKCVEPEICECLKGYFSVRSEHDGKHYCQPICAEPCPENSQCVAPNQCACRKGYQALKANCLATCSLGDHCKNGVCVAPDVCQCNYGFKWNSETSKCELLHEEQSSTFNPYFTANEQLTNVGIKSQTDIENSNEDIDPSQVFDEYIRTTVDETTDDYGSTPEYPSMTKIKCPTDYIYLKGKCQPLNFVSYDIDCWQKPCLDENAVCLENGTCACKEGFISLNSQSKEFHTPTQNSMTECLLPAEYETRMQELDQNPEKTEIAESSDWSFIFFIVLGLLMLSLALVFLGLKLLHRRSGEIDVEGKNLACVYDNRTSFEAEKSAI